MKSKDFFRLTSKFAVGDGCWRWSGAITPKGYGQVRWEGKCQLAHRVMYREFVGEIPEGLVLDHKCDTRNCVNPGHLQPVTNLENLRRGSHVTKRFCTNGHERTEENTYICKQNKKSCIICKKAAKARFEARRKATL